MVICKLSYRNSPVEIGVTTGPIRGSKKIHVAAKSGSGIKVAMREIQLEGGEAPVRVYDTSGPYTDPNAAIDIHGGLPQLRRQVARLAHAPLLLAAFCCADAAAAVGDAALQLQRAALCSGGCTALVFALCCSVNGEDAARALCRHRPILITGHAD